jgi:hypothetical protein
MDHLKPHVSEREAYVLPPSPSERHPIPPYAAQLASSGGTVTVSSVVHGTFSVLTTAMWARASPLKCTTGPSTCVCSSTTCASRTCARSHSQSKPVQNRPTHPDSQCSSSARQHYGTSRGATSSPARSRGPQSAVCGTTLDAMAQMHGEALRAFDVARSESIVLLMPAVRLFAPVVAPCARVVDSWHERPPVTPAPVHNVRVILVLAHKRFCILRELAAKLRRLSGLEFSVRSRCSRSSVVCPFMRSGEGDNRRE